MDKYIEIPPPLDGREHQGYLLSDSISYIGNVDMLGEYNVGFIVIVQGCEVLIDIVINNFDLPPESSKNFIYSLEGPEVQEYYTNFLHSVFFGA